MDWKAIEKQLDRIYSSEVVGHQIEDQVLDVKRYPSREQELISLCRHMAVCFANSDGGSLIIGVENAIKGPAAFTGCPKIDRWKLIKSIRDGTKPPVSIRIDFFDYKGTNLIVMDVEPGAFEGGHCLTDGSQTKRIGADCQPMFPAPMSPKFIHAERLDYSRAIVDGVSIDDLSKDEINIIRRGIKISNPSHDYLSLDDAELLKKLGMVKQKKDGTIEVTVAGVLFAGKEEIIKNNLPYSEIVFVSYDEKEQEETEVRYESGLLSMVFDLHELFMKKYNPINRMDTGLFEIQIPKVPEDVLREAFLNSVTHRDYNIQSSIFFRNYFDRIQLSNPGAFIDNITKNNILTHTPAWRNRLIAEIFQRIGLVRRSGLGVRRMYLSLLNSGKEPPLYFEDGNEIRLTIFDRVDSEIAKYLVSLEKKKQTIPLNEMIIISKIKSQREITTEEAAFVTQCSTEETKPVLTRMCNEGRIERIGRGTGTYYKFTQKMYSDLGNPIAYFSNGELEIRRQKELILTFLNDKGKIKNEQAQNLLKSDRSHAYGLLKEMVQNGDIFLVKKGRGSYYELKK